MSSHDTALDPSHLISRGITLVRWSEQRDRPLGDHSVAREGEKDESFIQEHQRSGIETNVDFVYAVGKGSYVTLHVYHSRTQFMLETGSFPIIA